MLGICDMNGDTAISFLTEFVALERSQRGRTVLDIARYRDMVQRHGLTQRDQYIMSRCLLKHDKNSDDRITGRKMIFTASAAGHEEATIRILSNALLGSKAQKWLLKNTEMRLAREQLQRIAQKGENYRAMVLEGKIWHELGDDEYAIKCWERALPLARDEVKEIDRLTDMGIEGQGKLLKIKAGRADFADLSAPWVELSAVHYDRYVDLLANKKIAAALPEREKILKALKIGCEMDDPTCHFRQAYWFGPHPNNDVKHTSTWLYHMTKAGASGHSQACHVLAEWYAGSEWPYLEDEPPDAIKPTPFDTYPASEPTQKEKESEPNPAHDLFHTATFPSTPFYRWKLARAWLQFPLTRLYAPSFLLLAQMLMEKTLYGTYYAPKSALNMKDSRYLYASRADHDAGIEIPGRRKAIEAERNRPAEPSPFRDPAHAKKLLTQVFYAVAAHKLRQQHLNDAMSNLARRRTTQGVSGVAEGDVVDEQNLPKEVPAWIRKWLRFENEREMYEGQIEELESDAKAEAEAHGWDIVDEVGGLVYKSGLQGQGQGPAAVAVDDGKRRGFVGWSY
ncbi:hypothetical protein EJ03DRAFT_337171 [Teratosphaeria nubilosa]|uniref:Uncharacterized protein n=1 Tax=Teratosphaeria nubilosa TaxID=161662 RepID=A0A6G1L612_9PEZI|nr:hypothetical protein EJ03DRAFT_337171 [Teratosphaeria nubilosa]